MREELLKMLKETENYISGQELCERLSVSRTAVWKAVNSLKEVGYEIEAVTNKGYRLISSPDVLLSDEIKSLLDTEWFGKEIIYMEEVDSTNNEIKRQADKEIVHGMLVISDSQTAGRGRRGRNWNSPPGTGIWMSHLLKPDLEPSKASMITLVAALACAKAIRDNTGLEALIKWPNDIVVNGHKVVGILTELSAETDYINYVVVGIGINANMTEFPEEIKATATSLRMESGHAVHRSAIVATYGKYFEYYYDKFISASNLSGLREEYEELLVNKGRAVLILGSGGEEKGIATGINDMGELLVEGEDGQVKNIYAGEVSVRGIYGYV